MRPYYNETGVTIYHGDCREVMSGIRVPLIVTDPPYGVGIQYGSHDDDADAHWDWFMPVLHTMRETAQTVVFTHRVAALRKLIDWTWVGCWSKPMSFGHRIGKWLPHWEPIFVYGKPSRVSCDVFSHNTEAPSGHPCPKPLRLISHLLDVFDGDPVLDPFMGSGTTLVAARQLGRRAIGIEIEERYCEIAAKRLAQAALPLWEQSP